MCVSVCLCFKIVGYCAPKEHPCYGNGILLGRSCDQFWTSIIIYEGVSNVTSDGLSLDALGYCHYPSVPYSTTQ